MYADSVTPSMERAITETNRRRAIQDAYNKENGIVPKSVVKDVREIIEMSAKPDETKLDKNLGPKERERLINLLTSEMKQAAKMLEFEHAMYLRDRIQKLRSGK